MNKMTFGAVLAMLGAALCIPAEYVDLKTLSTNVKAAWLAVVAALVIAGFYTAFIKSDDADE